MFKNLSERFFLQDLKQGLSNTGNFSDFNNEFKNTLNNHALIKSSKVRGNTKPHVNKIPRKEIMKRSNLKNIANKSGKTEDKKRYKIQRNVITKLNKKLKKAYFKEKLPKGKDVKDFWNFCKPYFTNKGVCNEEKIILVEKEEVLRKDSKISDTFNNYFVNITDELGIYKWGNIPQNCLDSTEKIKYFNNHPSIKTIKDKFRNSFNFKFEFVSTDIVLRCINEIDIKKSSSGEISPAIIKLPKKEILIPITNCINKCISIKSFPGVLKVAYVIPVFKKEDPNNKANYRPISLLPIISKIFERVLFEQIEKFSEKFLSPKLCGFRKGHSTQHALLNLLKNWQKTLDKSGVIGTVLMDLSKAYNCLPHDLLIAKWSAYGFEDSAASLISDYLSKRYQRVKIGSVFSSYFEILRGV